MNMLATPVPPAVAEDYFAQVQAFQADQLRVAQRTRRAAWWIAGIACGVALLEGFAIASLGPIHTVEWRLIRVDSATGVVDDVTTMKEAPKTVNEAVTRYFMAHYVETREGYAAPEAEYNFRATSLMSDPAEQARYAEDFKGTNPLSPQVVYGKDGYIRVHVESVSVLGPQLGQVRFTREEVKNGSAPKISHWVATIGFRWEPGARISNADREINPLGFVVTDYHLDAVTP